MPAGSDEKDIAIIDGGEAAGPTSVALRGGPWQTAQTIGISVGDALVVLECVVKRGEKIESPLDARGVISHFTDALERLVL